jgi:endonuclease G
MKVLALNSSPRGGGQSKTELMLNYLVGAMREAGGRSQMESKCNEADISSIEHRPSGRRGVQGIWEERESKVRKWVKKRGGLYVYVGPALLTDKIRTIGPNKVAIPTHFYKIVFDPATGEAVGFLMPNTKLKRGTIPHYVVPIRRIEDLTERNFLSELDEDLQDSLETDQPVMWHKRS